MSDERARDGAGPDSDDVVVTALGSGRYLVSVGPQRRIAYAAGTPDGCWVFLDGQVHIVRPVADTSGRSAAVRTDEMALAAPMPATVTVINVAPGQPVAHGDVLVMLEAMKMELPIRSPRDGRIKTVRCRQGELVQPGIPLVELE